MDSEIATDEALLVSVTENIALLDGYLKTDDVDSYNVGMSLYFNITLKNQNWPQPASFTINY